MDTTMLLNTHGLPGSSSWKTVVDRSAHSMRLATYSDWRCRLFSLLVQFIIPGMAALTKRLQSQRLRPRSEQFLFGTATGRSSQDTGAD